MSSIKKAGLIFLGCLALLTLSKAGVTPMFEKASKIGLLFSAISGVILFIAHRLKHTEWEAPDRREPTGAEKAASPLYRYDYSTFNIHRHDDLS